MDTFLCLTFVGCLPALLHIAQQTIFRDNQTLADYAASIETAIKRLVFAPPILPGTWLAISEEGCSLGTLAWLIDFQSLGGEDLQADPCGPCWYEGSLLKWHCDSGSGTFYPGTFTAKILRYDYMEGTWVDDFTGQSCDLFLAPLW